MATITAGRSGDRRSGGDEHDQRDVGGGQRLDGADGDGGDAAVDRGDAGESIDRKGATQQFTATGTYSDSSTQNLTASVTWASATTTVATITAGGSGDRRGEWGRARSARRWER